MSLFLATRALRSPLWVHNALRATALRSFSTAAEIPLARKPEAAAEVHDLDGVVVSPELIASQKSPIDWRLPHSTYSRDELESQRSGHHRPSDFTEWAALTCVRTLRRTYDICTGYTMGRQHEKAMLTRVMFLETVAGVPGMVGAMNRHLKSLRRMERDFGWIHTLLEEAENERMHLMTALLLKKPNVFLRMNIAAAQGMFFAWYAVMYAMSPRFCHRFVGYLEEEAFKTYTTIVEKIDAGKLPGFTKTAPVGARQYWNMNDEATLRDVFLAIRADENHHREVNHTFAAMHQTECNPFPPGY